MNHQDTKTPSSEEMARIDPAMEELDRIGQQIVDAAFKVHSALGPGLLESVYETCLFHELTCRGLRVERQVSVPIRYDGLVIESALTIDLLVEGKVVVELKAVERFIPVHIAQTLSYLKLTNLRLAYLINFHTALIKDGIKRMVR